MACKEYRFIMNKCFPKYQFKLENDLRTTSENDPKELWKILNNMQKTVRDKAEIPIHVVNDMSILKILLLAMKMTYIMILYNLIVMMNLSIIY